MGFRLAKLVAFVAVIVSGMSLAAVAAAQSDDVRVDIYLKDADILYATRALTAKTGLQFVFEMSSEPFSKITLKLDQVTADDAIRYICQAAGASWRRDENGVYIIGHPKAQVDETPKQTFVAPAKSNRIVERIQLMKADAEDVTLQLMGRQPDPNRLFKSQASFRAASQVGTDFPVVVPSPQLGAAQPVSQQTIENYNKPAANGEEGGDIIMPGESANQGIGGAAGGRGGGAGIGGGGQGGVGGGGGRQGNVAGGNARGLIPPGIDYFNYDPNDNSIVVRGTQEDIDELRANIAKFDVAPRQVLIKVEFITTGTSLAKSLGYDFLYQRNNVFFGTQPGSFAVAGDPIFLSYATGNVSMRMRALIQEGFGKTVNAPMIRTLNNQPASLTDSIQTTYFTSTVVSGAQGIVTSYTPVTRTAGTGINVTPRINGDDTITMGLSPQVQDLGQVRTSPDGQAIPDIDSESVSVVARVKDGQTIVLGGFNRKTDQGTLLKFPILGDLPVIGQFFRSTTSDRNNTELLIFVTPTIVRDEEVGGLGP